MDQKFNPGSNQLLPNFYEAIQRRLLEQRDLDFQNCVLDRLWFSMPDSVQQCIEEANSWTFEIKDKELQLALRYQYEAVILHADNWAKLDTLARCLKSTTGITRLVVRGSDVSAKVWLAPGEGWIREVLSV